MLNALRNASDHLPVVADYSFDDVTAGVTIVQSGGSTDVAEGGVADTFDIVPDSIPTQEVTVTITPDSELDLGRGVGVAVNRVFTTAGALIPQSVDVIAFDDAESEGDHFGNISFTVASSDNSYDGLTVLSLTANVEDNDVTYIELTGNVQEFAGPAICS